MVLFLFCFPVSNPCSFFGGPHDVTSVLAPVQPYLKNTFYVLGIKDMGCDVSMNDKGT